MGHTDSGLPCGEAGPTHILVIRSYKPSHFMCKYCNANKNTANNCNKIEITTVFVICSHHLPGVLPSAPLPLLLQVAIIIISSDKILLMENSDFANVAVIISKYTVLLERRCLRMPFPVGNWEFHSPHAFT